ncbi:MAG: hypothetical protein K0R51_585 [Cytophagaceae bacterium]|jgi:hypothetical protein|nr:hypothetical protein [Cytophagaceae bacterium]
MISVASYSVSYSRIVLFVAVLLGLLTGCKEIKENNKNTDPKANFLTIYENNDFSKSFIPIDVQQTADGGYLVLAKRRITESSFYGIYLMKADNTGKFVSGEEVSTDIVNPIYNLMKVGNAFYFFAMDRLSLETKLMSASEDGTATEISTIAGVIYPLYASLDEGTGQFILQHYNRDELKTAVSRISVAGVVTAQREFNIGFGDFDVEEPIIDHLTGNGKKLPFLTGSAGGSTYYFNGFYNYTLSTVFFSFNTSTPSVLQGYKDEKCISSMVNLGTNTFSTSKYAYGTNTFSPRVTINTASGSIASNSDLLGKTILELKPDAQVFLKRITGQGSPVLAYNSDTKNAQIAIYFYDPASGNFRGSKHFGYSNPYEVGNFIQTSDGGLAVVGTTYVAGRFPRIVLIKISKEEMNKDIH